MTLAVDIVKAFSLSDTSREATLCRRTIDSGPIRLSDAVPVVCLSGF